MLLGVVVAARRREDLLRRREHARHQQGQGWQQDCRSQRVPHPQLPGRIQTDLDMNDLGWGASTRSSPCITCLLEPSPRIRSDPMDKTIRFKLILMMVLEFFIWGAWFPLIFGYLPSLGFTPASRPGSSAPSRSPPSSACSSATSSRTGISPRRSSWPFSHLIGGVGDARRCACDAGRSGRSSR